MYLSTVPQIDSTDMIMTHTSFQRDGSPLSNIRFQVCTWYYRSHAFKCEPSATQSFTRSTYSDYWKASKVTPDISTFNVAQRSLTSSLSYLQPTNTLSVKMTTTTFFEPAAAWTLELTFEFLWEGICAFYSIVVLADTCMVASFVLCCISISVGKLNHSLCMS